MIWETILLLWLTVYVSNGLPRACSKIDKVEVDMTVPDLVQGRPMKTLRQATKISSEAATRVKLTKVEWEAVYCPAVEFGPFQDCKQARETIVMDRIQLREFRRINKALRPESCSGGQCDGIDEKACLRPTQFLFESVPFNFEHDLSSSWIHHRCSRKATSITVEADAIVVNLSVNLTSIEVPGIGTCAFHPTDKSCVMNHHWAALIVGKWKHETKVSEYPCIEKGDDRICYDKESKLQFALGVNKCTMLAGVTYCDEPPEAEPFDTHSTRVVTPETVYELSLQLEYENLEASFDYQVTMSRLRKTDLLLSSLLWHALGVSSDPLQEFLGFGLDNAKRSGNSVVGNVCHRHSEVADARSPGLNSTSKVVLFPSNTEGRVYEEMKVHIPFLLQPDLEGSSHFNLSKIKHGAAPVTDIRGALTYLLPSWIEDCLHFATRVLPFVNIILIFAVLLRKL
uniref:Glycoprotein n=1 Tax=Guadeloupe mosquito quaranja-like virus 1 TaxID=2607737 RepID=A0A894KEQ7_9ORTO|nr:MAG: hypothetical protein [Guadeloupe mosquito quaranja-like virus 1]QRW42597.1 MAG: hypothetical protein [Guadeloupe mosquito quaranja-like virus 1]QRW42598.1 MAG: hypothetical protein [Guadeloupe mosquito quaranja-like virus 1]